MRRFALALFAAGLVLALGSTLAADEVKDELKKLDGTWTATEGEANGQALPEDEVKKLKLKIKDGQYEVKVNDQTDKGNLKVNPKKKPKEVDAESIEGTNQGKTIKGIYEVDGDTLKACYQVGEGERPTEFKAPAGSTFVFFVFKRDK